MLTSILFAIAVTTSTPPPDAQLANDFVRALLRDDTTVVQELAPETADAGEAWLSAIEYMDRLDCMNVQSMGYELLRGDANERLLRVTIVGTGTTSGGLRRVEALPEIWLLKAVLTPKGWRLAEVMTAERQLALAITSCATEADARAMLDEHLDFTRVSSSVSWAAVDYNVGSRGIELTQFAREVAQSIGNAPRAEYARQMEATLNTLLRRFDEARRVANESVERSHATGDPDAICNAYFALAVTYWFQNDLQTAIEMFRRAADQMDATAEPRKAIRAMINMHSLYNSRGQLRAALAIADETEHAARKYGWLQGQVDALILQSVDAEHLGNPIVGDEAIRKAHALARRLRLRMQIDYTLYALAQGALQRHDPDEAIARLRESTGSNDIAMKIYLGEALEMKNRTAEAKAVYEDVVRIAANGNQAISAKARVQLSGLALREDPERALELARLAAEDLRQQSPTMMMEMEPKLAEGIALRALGRTAEAEEAFRTAIATIEAQRGSFAFAEATHADYFDQRLGPYRELMELLIFDGRTEEALRLSDRLKASLLDQVRTAERIDLAALLTDEERTTREGIEAEIAELNTTLLRAKPDTNDVAVLRDKLTDARARWEQLETTLYVRHGVQRTMTHADPLQSPEALLPSADDAILDYVVNDRQTMLFVLTRDRRGAMKIDVHTIRVESATLRHDVDHFLKRLASANFDYDDDARRLYRLLIAPAEAALRGKKTVAVIGDGTLWRLPFQALQDEDGQPLLAHFALFSAPSLTSLLRTSAVHGAARPSVLAIGNPRVDGSVTKTAQLRTGAMLGDLPDAAVEARAVAALYDRTRSGVLIGAAATESKVKEAAPRYDVLHVAAHAVTDDQQPLYSSILLARDSSRPVEDGMLEGREITQLALRARLAVLSACSTAQGHVRPGEGLIGLSWAFLVAGCPTIVAAQWRVPSESTAKLMIEFHRQLARGDRTVAEALRQAQLRMMKERRYRHPFYWSAFVVVGAGRS